MLSTTLRPWIKTLSSVAAVAILVAVPAFGLSRLGLGLLPGSSVAAAAEPWAMDAPANTATRLRVAQEAKNKLPGEAANDQDNAVLLTDWSYTASLGGGSPSR